MARRSIAGRMAVAIAIVAAVAAGVAALTAHWFSDTRYIAAPNDRAIASTAVHPAWRNKDEAIAAPTRSAGSARDAGNAATARSVDTAGSAGTASTTGNPGSPGAAMDSVSTRAPYSSNAGTSHWLRGAGVAALIGFFVAILIGLWLAKRLTKPWSDVVLAVRDGITSLRDRDYSVSVGRTSDDELGDLVSAYNALGDLLRRERLDLHQRELLLDTVIQTTPLALVLTSEAGWVVYSNIAARQLFLGGRKLEGHDFGELLDNNPPALRDALNTQTDTLFTLNLGDEPQVYHVSQRKFLLNAKPHRLILLKQLTRELAAQEVATWKKVIRVIAHELNNSLAPISSLAHSGRLLIHEPDVAQLDRVFTTIESRAAHLASFIDGYARFAKLPHPRLEPTLWPQFLARLQGAAPFQLVGDLPERAVRIDASQLEQVVINLLKNAVESGSPPEEIRIAVREAGEGFLLEVTDRGSGLKDEVLRDALLPFYSTKATGTGLGLTLCREIVEAHSGRLSLANRPEGGAVVTVWLPA